jgi:hypothetical protein
MFNRYVDGLATIAPDDPAVYAAGAQRLVMEGYLAPSAEPERESSTSHCGYAHTIIAMPALGAITMLPARRQKRASLTTVFDHRVTIDMVSSVPELCLLDVRP